MHEVWLVDKAITKGSNAKWKPLADSARNEAGCQLPWWISYSLSSFSRIIAIFNSFRRSSILRLSSSSCLVSSRALCKLLKSKNIMISILQRLSLTFTVLFASRHESDASCNGTVCTQIYFSVFSRTSLSQGSFWINMNLLLFIVKKKVITTMGIY